MTAIASDVICETIVITIGGVDSDSPRTPFWGMRSVILKAYMLFNLYLCTGYVALLQHSVSVSKNFQNMNRYAKMRKIDIKGYRVFPRGQGITM
ncbi:MAG TPA: hypothetical protein DEB31_03700 [Clostridiales bacterium]|nr:hypothetical protein [Clostridiales bacterium]